MTSPRERSGSRTLSILKSALIASAFLALLRGHWRAARAEITIRRHDRRTDEAQRRNAVQQARATHAQDQNAHANASGNWRAKSAFAFCLSSLRFGHSTMPTAKHSVPAFGLPETCGFPFGCVIIAWLFMAFNSPTAAETKRQPAKPEVKKPAPKKTTPTTKPSSEKTAPAGSGPSASSETGPNAAIAPEELVEFQAQPEGVKKLIETCLTLARQNLTYTYNSSDPAKGGLIAQASSTMSCGSTAT